MSTPIHYTHSYKLEFKQVPILESQHQKLIEIRSQNKIPGIRDLETHILEKPGVKFDFGILSLRDTIRATTGRARARKDEQNQLELFCQKFGLSRLNPNCVFKIG